MYKFMLEIICIIKYTTNINYPSPVGWILISDTFWQVVAWMAVGLSIIYEGSKLEIFGLAAVQFQDNTCRDSNMF